MRCLQAASAELDALSIRLTAEEADASRRDPFDRNGQSAHFKAGCVVWTTAILEGLFRCFADEVREEVQARCVVPDVLHIALAMSLSQGMWQAASVQDRAGLIRRVELVSSHAMGTDEWPEAFSFLDGRTINEQAFVTVWRVLGLSGDAFSDPAQSTTLRDLAWRRNRVAHGEETVLQAGRSLTYGDLRQKIDHVNDVVSNLYVAVDGWLADGGWRP